MDKFLIFDKKKFGVGCILGVVTLVTCFAFYSWKAGVCFLFLFLLLGGIKCKSDSKILKVLWTGAAIFGISFSSRMVVEADFLWKMEMRYIVLELVCIAIVFLFVFIFSLNTRASIIISSTFLIILSLINYYVLKFRGNEFTPMDIFSVQTAAGVARDYDFRMNAAVFYGLVFWGIIIFFSFVFKWKKIEDTSRKRSRCISIVIECALILIWYLGCSTVNIETWANYGTVLNGYFVNFSAQLIDFLKDKKPDDYSLEFIEEYEERYSNSKMANTEALPDVIVIMDETFSDLSVLGAELQTSEPVMPFFDSLQENTIKGYALASVFGGGTANSEYECLTGNSMGFITEGATVYQLYLNNQSFSMASVFSDLGYTCMATHPYLSDGWSRTRAWPYLGFDKMTFIEDYPQENLVRDFVSDQEMFEYLIKYYEMKQENENLFLFGVTMQNHGDYYYKDSGYTPSILLEGYEETYPDVEQYLGLINETDKALEYLVGYFEEVDHKVVVLFFGDHLPNLNKEFYVQVHGGTYETLDERMLQYKVPFMVWANYDIEEETVECTSINFLSTYVYEVAGIESPAYNRFLKDVKEIVPAMNAYGYFSKTQNKFLEYSKAEGEEKEILEAYSILQYNCLFDQENRSDVFFSN